MSWTCIHGRTVKIGAWYPVDVGGHRPQIAMGPRLIGETSVTYCLDCGCLFGNDKLAGPFTLTPTRLSEGAGDVRPQEGGRPRPPLLTGPSGDAGEGSTVPRLGRRR